MSRQTDHAPTGGPVQKKLARRIARLERRVRGVVAEERRRARRLERTHERRARFEARLRALREPAPAEAMVPGPEPGTPEPLAAEDLAPGPEPGTPEPETPEPPPAESVADDRSSAPDD
jgi:hypothetical protein